MSTTAPSLSESIAQRVSARIGRRLRDFTVLIDDGRIVLRGRANTYHVKQLAQHAAQEAFPEGRLENAIVVE